MKSLFYLVADGLQINYSPANIQEFVDALISNFIYATLLFLAIFVLAVQMYLAIVILGFYVNQLFGSGIKSNEITAGNLE